VWIRPYNAKAVRVRRFSGCPNVLLLIDDCGTSLISGIGHGDISPWALSQLWRGGWISHGMFGINTCGVDWSTSCGALYFHQLTNKIEGVLQGRLKICTNYSSSLLDWCCYYAACLLACIGCADSLLVDQDPLISQLYTQMIKKNLLPGGFARLKIRVLTTRQEFIQIIWYCMPLTAAMLWLVESIIREEGLNLTTEK